ncbi:MAG TPA: hypothetical protein VGK67_22770 [Myxococcales bacterium]|jgi:hypothetical protein
MREGPAIEALTRRLAECPREFLAEPRLRGKSEGVSVAAVVSDLLEDLGAPGPLSEKGAAAWEQPKSQDRNLMRLTLVACWLCHDRWFVEDRRLAEPARHWLGSGLRPLAELVAADLIVADPDRREELARLALSALELAPKGETVEVASDRLKALGSVERARIIREMRAKEEAARKLKAQMEAEAARQAAARYGSE